MDNLFEKAWSFTLDDNDYIIIKSFLLNKGDMQKVKEDLGLCLDVVDKWIESISRKIKKAEEIRKDEMRVFLLHLEANKDISRSACKRILKEYDRICSSKHNHQECEED